MRSYYILRSGRLSQKDKSLLFSSGYDVEHTLFEDLTEDEQKNVVQKSWLPVEEVDSIYFFGETDTNSRALGLLGSHGICAHYFNYYGWYTGSFVPRKSLISGETTVRQSEHYLNEEKRMVLAREFVSGSIYSMREVLRPHSEKNAQIKTIMDEIKGLQKELIKQANIPAVMGIEGNTKIKYYMAIKQIIPDEFEFEKRVKHPPDNAVNALISFVNSLVYTAILKELYSTPLHPSVGFLHEPFERRYTLVLDISEIFKPLIGDKIILELLNNKRLRLSHFDKDLNYCYLNDSGRKVVVSAFDEKVKSTIKHKKLKKMLSWKQMIRMELYKIMKHITKDEQYNHFRLK
ncbi:MAG: type I-B CRISPR-associated endonuclease Cas1b [Deferribacteraceae bacterium]|jgi:CRISPR-associated protein Cas1|nr:type I-B CRISPR-associated endonuclease Cas1b [Deferribacteraceae bacterium]